MVDKILDQRISIITGGARGIGKAISESLAKEGCKVIIIDPGYTIDGNFDEKNIAEKTAEEISNKYNVETLAITKDISIEKDMQNSIELIMKKFNSIDIVVNNAAILKDGFIFKYALNDWKKVIDTNLTGAFNLISQTSKIMKEQSKKDSNYTNGRIINVISTAGIWGNFGQAAYASAKSGLIGLTRVAALDLQRLGITCNAIAPFASTRVTESINPQNEAQEKYKKSALKVEAKYIGDLTAFLASNQGKKYSGQIFGVRAKEVFLFNQARPIYNFVRKNDDYIKDMEVGFKNNFDNNLTTLETDLDAFSSEPIID
jgi:NAD(P)-dependent dehydrogenase (short-subunit alcohol dehydrogenase family)|tara:strand:- start:331 stop:1278 length:948 start_codon:yes stop_codon:yes gene_type:complete